jgi:hypothetical protein
MSVSVCARSRFASLMLALFLPLLVGCGSDLKDQDLQGTWQLTSSNVSHGLSSKMNFSNGTVTMPSTSGGTISAPYTIDGDHLKFVIGGYKFDYKVTIENGIMTIENGDGFVKFRKIG